LTRLIELIYIFKANFDEDEKVEEGLSVYNQLDPGAEERLFNHWEMLC